jgi:FkbM family methyltransferase
MSDCSLKKILIAVGVGGSLSWMGIVARFDTQAGAIYGEIMAMGPEHSVNETFDEKIEEMIASRVANKVLVNAAFQQQASAVQKLPETKVASPVRISAPEAASISELSLCVTSSRGWEVVFESLLGNLLREKGFLPDGDVLDVGAQFGEQACHFAMLAPGRQVYAMDPSPKHTDKIKSSKFGSLPNLHVITSGIGKEVGSMIVPDSSFGMPIGSNFSITTIDALFFNQGKQLSFAHIDVEGLELDTIMGGEKTIRANKPVFTAELRVHKDHNYSKALLDFIDGLGYDSYLVDEVCGYPHMDFRNMINIPRTLSQKLTHSDAFSFALATQAIFRVDSSTVFDKVYTCCAPGAECCANGDVSDKNCCSQQCVAGWMKNSGMQKAEVFHGWQSARKTTLGRWKELKARGKVE